MPKMSRSETDVAHACRTSCPLPRTGVQIAFALGLPKRAIPDVRKITNPSSGGLSSTAFCGAANSVLVLKGVLRE